MADTNYSMICSSQANSAAVIRLHSLGDVILSQPVATKLSELCNEVFFVTDAQYQPVVNRMPGNIHSVSAGSNGNPFDMRKLLGRISPDVVIDLQNNFATRFAAIGKPVPGRFHMNRKLRKKVMKKKAVSMPLRTSEFLHCAGFEDYSDPILERVNETAHSRLRIGIVTGGRWRLKSIPAEVITETARVLTDLYHADIVLLGGVEDRELILRAASSTGRSNIEVYRGERGIEGLIETVESLDLLISPDSGPAHLASALSIPVLVVFTSTSPALGFWKKDRSGNFMVPDVECRPCHRHGGRICSDGSEKCRKGILPFALANRGMELIES